LPTWNYANAHGAAHRTAVHYAPAPASPRAALAAADHNARRLFDRLDDSGKIRLHVLVADDGFPQTSDRFGDFSWRS
jgi:hypothetical protein